MRQIARSVDLAAETIFSSLFVWVIWALMLVAAIAFVNKFGSNVPSWDGWDMVPTLTGHQPVTTNWLWSQHNEHRVPLPRLMLLGLHRITGINFRTPMFFDVFAIGALAFAMIMVMKRLRGRTSYLDAFLPLVLLNWGQATNFIWGWQLQFYASTVLAGIILLLILQGTPDLKTRTAIGIGVCLVLLPLCGANGLILVPALALWLCYSAILRWRSGSPHAHQSNVLIFGLSLSALLLVILYLIGYERVPYHPTPHSLTSIGKTSIQIFTLGFGPATRTIWPISGLVVLCLLFLSTLMLLRVWYQQPQECYRASGLLAFLGAMTSLALSLGLGRDGFEPRYVTLAVPAWCCVYYVLSLYSSPKHAFVFRMLLPLIAGFTLWPNTQWGINYAINLQNQLGAFERDMIAGVPPYQLINRYGSYLHPHQDILSEYMPMLHRSSVGEFRSLRENPDFRELMVPLEPNSLNQVQWESGIAHMTGHSPHIVFTLPQAQYVSGIRLKYEHSNSNNTLPYVSIWWKGKDQDEFTKKQFQKYSPTGDRANWERGTWTRLAESETIMTVWVCDVIKELRIDPDFNPGTFKISQLVLLIPADDVSS